MVVTVISMFHYDVFPQIKKTRNFILKDSFSEKQVSHVPLQLVNTEVNGRRHCWCADVGGKLSTCVTCSVILL